MRYIVGYCSDVGLKKTINQDSFCVKRARTAHGEIAMIIICDGMGGLSKGELASAEAIKVFSEWFDNELPRTLSIGSIEEICKIWETLIYSINIKLIKYGEENNIQLGTTLTGILILENGEYLIGHVGDSRIYQIDNQGILQLTEDHTLVAREVKHGKITKEQALLDPRRNVLLQCIGVSQEVFPQIMQGVVSKGTIFLLCSDGFRHLISEIEILQQIKNKLLMSEQEISELLRELTEWNKQRGEKDNITAVLCKVI